MSRKPVHNDARDLEDLPLFRQPDAVDDETAAAEPTVEGAGGEDVEEALEALDDVAPPPATRRPRARAMHAAASVPGPVHTVWIGVGVCLFVLGILLAVATASRPASVAQLLEACARLSLTPALLLGFGLATWGVGVLLGRQQRNAQLLAQTVVDLHATLDAASRIEDTALALQEAAGASASLSGDDIGHVLFALQRHEEKLNNLTKATKTFGKPLVEMTTQLAEVAAQISQGQTNVQAVRVAAESGFGRVEELLRQQSEGESSKAEEVRRALEQATAAWQGTLDGALRELSQAPSAVQGQLASLTQELDRKLVASGQRVCAELGRELGTRLEELGKSSREAGIDLTPIHNAIAALRRDLAGLASSTGSTRKVPEAAPAAAPAATTAPPAAKGSDDVPASGLAQTIAGERSTKGANTLGAIAKLKKMRS